MSENAMSDVKSPRMGSVWHRFGAAALVGIVGLCTATGVMAHDWKHKHKHGPYYYVPGPAYVVAPAPVVYAAPPRPVVVYPEPVYAPAYAVPVAPAYPAYPGGSVNLGINIPLR